MANAVARTKEFNAHSTGMVLWFDVIFTGSDTPDGSPLQTEVSIETSGSETLAALRTKLTAGISAKAVELGFTCVGANMIIPSFQKG